MSPPLPFPPLLCACCRRASQRHLPGSVPALSMPHGRPVQTLPCSALPRPALRCPALPCSALPLLLKATAWHAPCCRKEGMASRCADAIMPPSLCSPAGSFSAAGAATCTLCPINTIARNEGMGEFAHGLVMWGAAETARDGLTSSATVLGAAQASRALKPAGSFSCSRLPRR